MSLYMVPRCIDWFLSRETYRAGRGVSAPPPQGFVFTGPGVVARVDRRREMGCRQGILFNLQGFTVVGRCGGVCDCLLACVYVSLVTDGELKRSQGNKSILCKLGTSATCS